MQDPTYLHRSFFFETGLEFLKGYQLTVGLLLSAVFLVSLFLVKMNQKKTISSSTQLNQYILTMGLGLFIYIITAELVHDHYFLLLTPLLIYLYRPLDPLEFTLFKVFPVRYGIGLFVFLLFTGISFFISILI